MKLKTLREQKGLTQKEVCTSIGIHPVVYNRYEKEKLELPLSIAIKLADLYDVTLDELVGRERKEVKKDAE